MHKDYIERDMLPTMKLRFALLLASLTARVFGQEKGVDYYSAADLQKQAQEAASQQHKAGEPSVRKLQTYVNDYSLVVARDKSGQAELHEHESDLYLVLDGAATIVTGGTMVDRKMKSEGEFVGSSITGGHSQKLAQGDVVHISPQIPHQLVLEPGATFRYFVLKVKE